MTDPKDIESAYDDMDLEYDDRVSTDAPEPVREFLRRLSPDDLLLDAGVGGGDPAIAAHQNAVGLDLSRTQLEEATRHLDVALVRGDMTRLPFDEDTFDAVAAIHSLIHVPLADHSRVIEEFRRVLRPGGVLLVTEGGEEWTGSNPDWLESGVEMHWEMAGADETRRQLEEHGFDIAGRWDVPDPTAEDAEKPYFVATLDD